jgi:hypothetical protein
LIVVAVFKLQITAGISRRPLQMALAEKSGAVVTKNQKRGVLILLIVPGIQGRGGIGESKAENK